MPDEAGRWTAEHTVMESGIEIRELKHLLEVKDKKIKELESQIVQLKSPDYPKDEVSFGIAGVAEESEDEFTEQLSFTYNQE